MEAGGSRLPVLEGPQVLDRARVLVLEDDTNMRDLLAGVLEDEGYAVVAVSRGEEAVQRASQESFDLVVLDIRMEGIDGLEALARMKQHLHGAASLVMTGYASEADPVRALRLGVGDYLRKPFDRTDFLDRVGRLVARSRDERQRDRRDSLLRALGPWAAGAMARCLEVQGLPPGGAPLLARAGLLAGRLARGAGLASPDVEGIRVATMLVGVHRLFGGPLAEPDDPEILPAASDALRWADERWDGQGEPEGRAGDAIPLAARIADLALAALQEEECRADELAARHPGRFDPRLLDAVDEARAARDEARPSAGARGRGLLALGRALLAAGDVPSARQAFLQAAAGPGGPEAVEAYLGLAETADGPSEAEDLVVRALGAARRAGPAAAARAALEGGLLLMQAAAGGAASLLHDAAERLEGLQADADAARARLALASLGKGEAPEPALSILLQPDHAEELAASSRWLLPMLLQAPANPETDRALERLVREGPSQLGRLLLAGSLDPRGRRRAAALLAGAPALAPAGLLERLAGDPDPEVRAMAVRALEAPEGAPPAPVLRIHSFGPLEAWLGERRVEEGAWRSARVKFLFAFLAAQEGRPVTEDRLVETFWPDDAEKGRKGVYWAVSTLRRCLKPWGPDPVGRSRGLIQLNPELPLWHDLDEMERTAASARAARGDRRAALAAWQRVATLYRGPYLEGCYMDWALNLRQRVESMVREALVALHAARQEAGMPGEALECARRLVELDPLSQEAHRMCIQSLVDLGRSEEALLHFETCQRALRRELDLEPSIDLLEAYHRAKLSLL